jgi:hypothetical protein
MKEEDKIIQIKAAIDDKEMGYELIVIEDTPKDDLERSIKRCLSLLEKRLKEELGL